MSAPLCPILQDGAWTSPESLPTADVFNPSRGEVIARVPLCGAAEVDQAVRAAQEAFPAWRETPPIERARILFRYKALLEQEFAAIFTRSGGAARQFRHRINSGMVGINVGVPAPMACFPFSGWGDSFFGDLHLQGREGVSFYTRQKVTTSRWFAEGEGNIWNHK